MLVSILNRTIILLVKLIPRRYLKIVEDRLSVGHVLALQRHSRSSAQWKSGREDPVSAGAGPLALAVFAKPHGHHRELCGHDDQ